MNRKMSATDFGRDPEQGTAPIFPSLRYEDLIAQRDDEEKMKALADVPSTQGFALRSLLFLFGLFVLLILCGLAGSADRQAAQARHDMQVGVAAPDEDSNP